MNVYIFCSLCVLPLLDLSLGAAIRRNDFRRKNEQMQYLERFGYLDAVRDGSSGRKSSSRLRGSEFEAAVRLFQRKAHIPETGVMNAQTIRMMSKPRCGVPDFPTRGGRGPLQFTLTNSKWNVSNIFYQITKFSSQLQLSEAEQANAIHQAFEMWGREIPLTFTRSQTSQIDIDISFAIGDHGDGVPFFNDTVLAHADDPQDGGDIHFNDYQSWSLSAHRGTDLFQVALHEIGHSLGLNHSDNEGAVMYKTYQKGLHPVQLHPDDIAGIQHIYSRRRVDPSTTANPTTTTTANPTTTTTANPTTTTTANPATTAPPPGTTTYNCDNNSPCTPEKTSGGQYYFPHDNRHKYVQCDNWGQCWDRDCGATLVWNPVAYTCTRR